MEDFENFIFGLFEKQGYGSSGQLQAGVHLFKHHANDDYWIVTDGLVDEDEQYNLYCELTKAQAEKYPYANKNTSLLLLVDMDKVKDAEKDESLFVQIENNPLYFKKYILPFSQSSYESMMKVIQGKNVLSIEKLIMEDDTFDDMRDGKEYAELLYTIVHKLPFLPIEVSEQKAFQQTLAYTSDAVRQLAERLDNYHQEEMDINHFVEELITDYEDEKD